VASLVNDNLGKYKILNEIGRGGMATVYKAWDAEHSRHVAIKVLHAQLTVDALFVKRFRQEAAAVSSLSHPNIVAVYDVGQEDDFHYLVMEYLEGQPLSRLMEPQAPWPLTRTLRVIRQVADALDYAHSKGFIHRDIKPSNIIVGPGDHATLTDFGIAKATRGTTLTRTGMLIGTPQYMSPEQCLGRHVDSRSDIYSLGVVLYEMLTRRVPFTADNTLSILYKHVHGTAASPASVNPAVPTRVEPVVAKALEKQPDKRHSTAGEMALALERALAGGPTPEEVATAATRTLSRQAPRARRRLGLIGVVVAVASIAVGALLLASLAHLPGLSSRAAVGITETPVTSEQAAPARDQLSPTTLPPGVWAPSPMPRKIPEPTRTVTITATHAPTLEPTPTWIPMATPTSAPPTATQIPPSPAPTQVPASPTAVDWTTADWTAIAGTLLGSARKYLPQTREVYQSLGEDPVDCPRLAEAPHHDGMIEALAVRRGYPSVEGELWNIRDAYADAVNQFRLDTFRSIRNGCVSGTQPSSEQRQRAKDWMDLTNPSATLEYVIAHLEPVAGG
jgi:serine/threonine protein kinase